MVWCSDICPKLPKIDPKNELLNPFNNFCNLRKSFNLRMQDIFEISNQKVNLSENFYSDGEKLLTYHFV